MNTGVKIAIGLFALILLSGIGCFTMINGVYNTCILHEAQIEAQYKQNQNNYDNMFKKILEVSQVTDKYAKDLKELFDNTMKGRYGKDGSKAMFQFLKEHNPTLDTQVYTKLQNIIASGRTDFMNEQKMLLDKKQAYDIYRKQLTTAVISGFMGFPKIDLKSMDIVTSDETEAAFKTKKAAPLKLN